MNDCCITPVQLTLRLIFIKSNTKECWFDICAAFQCNSAAVKRQLTKTGDRQMFVRDAQEHEDAVSHSVFIISV